MIERTGVLTLSLGPDALKRAGYAFDHTWKLTMAALEFIS